VQRCTFEFDIEFEILKVQKCYFYKKSIKTRLCNIHKAKALAYIFILRCKFYTIKIEEDNEMLAQINKVKALADQLDSAMTLLETLPSLRLISEHRDSLESRLISELPLKFVIGRLLHKLL